MFCGCPLSLGHRFSLMFDDLQDNLDEEAADLVMARDINNPSSVLIDMDGDGAAELIVGDHFGRVFLFPCE